MVRLMPFGVVLFAALGAWTVALDAQCSAISVDPRCTGSARPSVSIDFAKPAPVVLAELSHRLPDAPKPGASLTRPRVIEHGLGAIDCAMVKKVDPHIHAKIRVVRPRP